MGIRPQGGVMGCARSPQRAQPSTRYRRLGATDDESRSRECRAQVIDVWAPDQTTAGAPASTSSSDNQSQARRATTARTADGRRSADGGDDGLLRGAAHLAAQPLFPATAGGPVSCDGLSERGWRGGDVERGKQILMQPGELGCDQIRL